MGFLQLRSHLQFVSFARLQLSEKVHRERSGDTGRQKLNSESLLMISSFLWPGLELPSSEASPNHVILLRWSADILGRCPLGCSGEQKRDGSMVNIFDVPSLRQP